MNIAKNLSWALSSVLLLLLLTPVANAQEEAPDYAGIMDRVLPPIMTGVKASPESPHTCEAMAQAVLVLSTYAAFDINIGDRAAWQLATGGRVDELRPGSGPSYGNALRNVLVKMTRGGCTDALAAIVLTGEATAFNWNY